MGRLAAVVPVLNESEAIAEVVSGLRRHGACCVLVVDGGSSDATRERAAKAGGLVIEELRPGYGRACLTGAEAAQAHHVHDLVAFLDGDGSCDPRDLSLLSERTGDADVVLGRREAGSVERGAYPWHARIGNFLAATLIRWRSGRRVDDLPPFKVLRASALARLQLRQEAFAWTTELVARSCMDRALRIDQAPISFRARRGGKSKVSGRLVPSVLAGVQILRAAVAETSPRPRVVLMAKGPLRAKSRLAAEAGAGMASGFWAASVRDTSAQIWRAAATAGLEAHVMLSAPDEIDELADLLGPAWILDVQERPGLSQALVDVFMRSFDAGAPYAMAISGDNPSLPPSVLRDAVEILRRRDAVIGPTPDGGYYLVGFRRSALPRGDRGAILYHIFDHRVSGEAARAAAHGAMLDAGLSVGVLQPWPDVDNLGDLRRLAIALAATPEAAPATSAWLVKHARWLLPSDAADLKPGLQVIPNEIGGSDVTG